MQRPGNDSREIERRFFADVAARNAIRVSVRALIVLEGQILLQRMTHPGSYHFFPGGEIELGEQMEAAMRRELAEESTLAVRRMVYRFTANNRFERDGAAFHFVEHYFEATPATFEVESLEESVLVEWYPVDRLRALDLRPWGVRDALGIDGWRTVRLLEVE